SPTSSTSRAITSTRTPSSACGRASSGASRLTTTANWRPPSTSSSIGGDSEPRSDTSLGRIRHSPRMRTHCQDAGEAGVPTLLYLVGRLDRVVRRGIQDAVKEQGLSVNEYATLSVLAHRHGLSNAQLARRSLVSPQSANEVLLALERKGLVVRRAH